MPLIYRLEDYARYRERVGDATIIDVTRRTDPARIPEVWQRLRDVVAAYGAPWVVQVWTKDPAGVLRLGGDTLRALVGAGVTLAAQVTVTGLAGTVWEPHVPPDGLQAAAGLAALAGGPEHLAWRYDPVIPGVHTPERFRALTRSVADLGVQCGIINLVAAPGTYAVAASYAGDGNYGASASGDSSPSASSFLRAFHCAGDSPRVRRMACSRHPSAAISRCTSATSSRTSSR